MYFGAGVMHLRRPLHRLPLEECPKQGSLYLRQMSEHYGGDPLECECCGDVIHRGSQYYCCEWCRFYVHKHPCAEAPLPPQIQRHPSHPHHPLTLQISKADDFSCYLCKWFSSKYKDWFYRCESCSDFNLHAICAVGTLPNNEDELDGGTTSQHVEHIHQHPLSSLFVKLKNRSSCGECQKDIFGETYACFECRIFFHKACIDGPREILRHPFIHPLGILVDDSGSIRYSCKECGILPFHTSTSMWTLPRKEDDDVKEQESRSTIHDFGHHQHPLNPYHATKETPYDCRACCEPIVNGFYGCNDCRFLIHESCANAPSKIQHYLHPDHPLSLFLHFTNKNCASCKYFRRRSFTYHCETCNFVLHMECARKTLVYLEEGAPATIQHFSHEHKLTLHHLTKNRWEKHCYGCAHPIEGPGYKCCMEYCEFFIHKSCLELPSVIQQSSHSHPLAFRHEESNEEFTCCACGRKQYHFVFSCTECELNFDPACAPLERHILKERLHEHDLFYVAEYQEVSQCKVCGEWYRVDLFRCWECRVSVHYECVHLLSKIVRSNFHVDPLTLCESVAEDDVEDDYDEYYCDICEGIRDPKLWVYYCAECEFIAHVKCAISLVRPEYVKENPELRHLDEEIGRAQQVVDVMEADLKEKEESSKALRENLETLETKLAEVMYFGAGVMHLRRPLHRLRLEECPKQGSLYLRQMSEHYGGDPLECEFCGDVIHRGSQYYCCEWCRFYVHKHPCAEAPLPPQIQRHPSHPHHPLTLTLQISKADDFFCYLCKYIYPSYKDWFYRCESCSDFNLHAICAVGTLPNNEDELDGGTTSQHVEHIHQHPLSSLFVKLKNRFHCDECREYIFGETYAGFECRIFFHKGCIDGLREILRHPFIHPLGILVHDSSSIRYSCKECGIMPFHTSTSMLTLPRKEEDDVRGEESLSAIHHFAHDQHPLNPYHTVKEIPYDCNACCEPIVNGFYGCNDCRFLIHESCANPPSKIQHYLHPDHPLSLVPNCRYSEDCESCKDDIIRGFAYYCKTCNFALHMECVRKTLSYLEEGAPATIRHFSHEHELILHHHRLRTYLRKYLEKRCYGCARPIEGPGYGCRVKNCKFFIHKSCLELPSIVQKSSHSHPLSLRHEESNDGLTCCACGWKPCHFVFSCVECKLNFDAACALLGSHVLKEHLHEHDLFYVAEYQEVSQCKVCGKQCSTDLFRCLQCGFSVHYECIHLLSKTIVSNFHVDPLTLYESFVEDDSEENCCDICEGRRNPELYVYCCIECQFFAHVKCATSPVRLDFTKEKIELRNLEKKIECIQPQVVAIEVDVKERKASLEAQRENLKAMTRRREELAYQS